MTMMDWAMRDDPNDPYALRVGHDYHLAEVKRAHGGWRAEDAACGWAGEVRGSKDAAENDAYTHDVTHN